VKQPTFTILCMPITESMRLGDMSTGEPIPEGVYPVRIAKVEIRRPDPTDKNPDPYEYASVQFVVIAHPDVDEVLHGRYIFDNPSFAPNANHRLRKLTEAVFGKDEDIDVVDSIKSGRFENAEVLASVVIQKAGKGKDGKYYEAKNNIVKYLPLEEGA
jgi:hypothetical protein